MKRLLESMLFFVFTLSLSGCMTDIDNYDGPKETFKGTIIDKFTNEPILTETGGIRIRMEELSWSDTPTPYDFGNKEDGTFFNSMIFKGHYRVTLDNGPFVPIEPVELDIKGVTTHDFIVEPYLHVDITKIIQDGTSVTVKFKVSSKVDRYNVTHIRVFVNNTVFVGSGACITDYSPEQSVEGMTNAKIYSMEHSITINNLKSGRKFYLRAAARVNDPNVKKYNFSKIESIDVP